MFKLKRAGVIAVAAALALAGCSSGGSGGDSGSSSGSSGGTLNLGLIIAASTFAAKDMRWANESPYAQAAYDSLLKADPDGTIKPNLATKWSYNDDNTVLTLTLRDDVKFVDGEKLTADAAAKSILAFKAGTSPNAPNLKFVSDAKATDDTTLEITLSAPDPALLTYLTQNAGLVESPKADPATIDTVPDGTGPYTLNTKDTVVGSSYVFDKNKDYWNPSDQHYDKVVMNVYSDSTSQLNAIQGGQVNVSGVNDNTVIPQVESAGFTTESNELDWTGFMLLDRNGTIQPALKDVKVRQAINYALDRKTIQKTLGAGYGTLTEQVFPPYSSSYDKKLDSFYDFDLAKAKQLMKEAGYAGGFSVTMPRTTFIPAANFDLMAEQLAQIGIKVTYEDPGTQFIPQLLSAKYPMSWFVLQEDPSDFQLANFQISTDATWNIFHVEDPTVTDLIGQMQTGDEAQQTEAGKKLNKYVVENAFFAPFYRNQNTKAVDANTTVKMQAGNTWPYLWNIQPK
jgi:peptide/nickel transport system substrate-binding protein